LLPASIRSLNSDTRSFDARGYFSICFDRLSVNLRLHRTAVVGPVFFLYLLRTSCSCNRSLSFFHFITRDLLIPLSFATAKNVPTLLLVVLGFDLIQTVKSFFLVPFSSSSSLFLLLWPCPDWPLILNSLSDSD
jgi:hypothetical protein